MKHELQEFYDRRDKCRDHALNAQLVLLGAAIGNPELRAKLCLGDFLDNQVYQAITELRRAGKGTTFPNLEALLLDKLGIEWRFESGVKPIEAILDRLKRDGTASIVSLMLAAAMTNLTGLKPDMQRFFTDVAAAGDVARMHVEVNHVDDRHLSDAPPGRPVGSSAPRNAVGQTQAPVQP